MTRKFTNFSHKTITFVINLVGVKIILIILEVTVSFVNEFFSYYIYWSKMEILYWEIRKGRPTKSDEYSRWSVVLAMVVHYYSIIFYNHCSFQTKLDHEYQNKSRDILEFDVFFFNFPADDYKSVCILASSIYIKLFLIICFWI